jgi:hypothetical protein
LLLKRVQTPIKHKLKDKLRYYFTNIGVCFLLSAFSFRFFFVKIHFLQEKIHFLFEKII